MATVDRIQLVSAFSAGFDFFYDHHNPVFRFDPLAVVPDLSQTRLAKVLFSDACLST